MLLGPVVAVSHAAYLTPALTQGDDFNGLVWWHKGALFAKDQNGEIKQLSPVTDENEHRVTTAYIYGDVSGIALDYSFGSTSSLNHPTDELVLDFDGNVDVGYSQDDWEGISGNGFMVGSDTFDMTIRLQDDKTLYVGTPLGGPRAAFALLDYVNEGKTDSVNLKVLGGNIVTHYKGSFTSENGLAVFGAWTNLNGMIAPGTMTINVDSISSTLAEDFNCSTHTVGTELSHGNLFLSANSFKLGTETTRFDIGANLGYESQAVYTVGDSFDWYVKRDGARVQGASALTLTGSGSVNVYIAGQENNTAGIWLTDKSTADTGTDGLGALKLAGGSYGLIAQRGGSFDMSGGSLNVIDSDCGLYLDASNGKFNFDTIILDSFTSGMYVKGSEAVLNGNNIQLTGKTTVRSLDAGNVKITADNLLDVNGSTYALLAEDADSSLSVDAAQVMLDITSSNGNVAWAKGAEVSITASVSSTVTGGAYGLYASNGGSVVLNGQGVHSVSSGKYVLYANGMNSRIESGDNFGTLRVSAPTAEQGASLLVNNGGKIAFSGDTVSVDLGASGTYGLWSAEGEIDLSVSTLVIDKDEGNDSAFQGTSLYAKGGTITISADRMNLAGSTDESNVNAYTVRAREEATVTVNEGKAGYVLMKGGVYAEGKSAVTLNFGSASSWTGFSKMENEGSVDVSLLDASTWSVTTGSTVDNIAMQNGILRMDYRPNGTSNDPLTYKTLTVNRLGGVNESAGSGELWFNLDLALETSENPAQDYISAKEVSGSYVGHVNFDNPKDVADKLITDHYMIRQESGSMTVANPNGEYLRGNGMISAWTWKFVPDSIRDTLDTTDQDELWSLTNTSDNEAGDWVLVRVPSVPGTDLEPADPINPGSEAGSVLDVGSTIAQAISWLSEKNDLRRRLGEVRYGSQAGVWVKAFNRKDRAQGFRNNSFKQRSSGVHIGYDTFVSKNESAAWLVGATFRYARSNQEGLETANGGTGDMNEYSGKLYATWMHDSGAYADMLVQVGYYDQDIQGISNDGASSWTTNYGSWGAGASVELGHMITLWDDSDDRRWHNHVFFEPQIELSYFRVKGEHFKLSTGMKVDQEDGEFLTGRLGFVLGKKFSYGTLDDLDRRYFQIGVIAGLAHEFMGDQSIKFTGTDGATLRVDGHGLGGTSYYYGLTADWQVSDRVRFYAELDREEGDHYTKEYGINVGFKYSF